MIKFYTEKTDWEIKPENKEIIILEKTKLKFKDLAGIDLMIKGLQEIKKRMIIETMPEGITIEQKIIKEKSISLSKFLQKKLQEEIEKK